MSKPPQFVIKRRNGKLNYSIEYFPAGSIEPNIGEEIARIDLTSEQQHLRIKNLIYLYETGNLK